MLLKVGMFKKALLFALLSCVCAFAFSMNLGASEPQQEAPATQPAAAPAYQASANEGFKLGFGIGIYGTFDGDKIVHFGGMPSVYVQAGIIKDVASLGVGAEFANVPGSDTRRQMLFEMKVRDEFLFKIMQASPQNQYNDTYFGLVGECKLVTNSAEPTMWMLGGVLRSESANMPLYGTADFGIAWYKDSSDVCFLGSLGIGARF